MSIEFVAGGNQAYSYPITIS